MIIGYKLNQNIFPFQICLPTRHTILRYIFIQFWNYFQIVVSDHKYQDKPQGFSVNSKPTPKPRNPNLICSNYDDDEREQRIKPEFELQKGPRPMSRQTSLISELRISTRDLEATGPPDRTYKVVFAVSVLLKYFKS